MTAFPKAGGRRLALQWALEGVALIYLLSLFVPWRLPGHYGPLDDSWIQVSHLAFQQHWQWGRDIIFTFGPWGFLYAGYSPATHGLAVASWALLALVFWGAARRVSHHFSSNPFVAWLWLLAFCAAAGIQTTQYLDARLLAWAGLLLFLHFLVEDKPLTILQGLLVVTLGWLGLVRFNLMIAAAAVVTVISADVVLRHRRFPWVVPLFVASLLMFWLGGGQSLKLFGGFLVNSLRMTSGYSEAMTLTSSGEGLEACGFLLFCCAVGLMAGYTVWKRRPPASVPFAAGLIVLLFLSFKHGYIRFDDHEIAAATSLLLLAFLGVAVLWAEVRNQHRWMGFAGVLVTAGLAGFVVRATDRWQPAANLPRQTLSSLNPLNWIQPVRTIFDSQSLQKDYTNALAGYRHDYPLPLKAGEADLYHPCLAVMLAQGLTYRPRPLIQSCGAYSPALAQLNLAHLQTHPPENILLGINPIDGRYPALEDGPSWPELLARFNVEASEGRFVWLRRRSQSRQCQMDLLWEIPFVLGEPISLPETNHGLLWAEMEINRSLAGDVVCMLYKPPVLWMSASLRGGQTLTFRIVPAMARSRFLLSPYIGSAESFALLASTNSAGELNRYQVDSIKVYAATSDGKTACYKSPLRLRLYTSAFSRETGD